jgi:hypothetical protein
MRLSKGKATPNGLVRLVVGEIMGRIEGMTEELPVKPPLRP